MGQISYGPLLGPERGRPLMDLIKYGPTFGPKHGSQLMGRPTRVLKILWAYSWADPLMSAKSHGPLAGLAQYGPQKSGRPSPRSAHLARKNLVGLYLGRPIMARKILWAFSWASLLWSAKSRGPLAGPAHYGPQKSCGPANYGPQKYCGPLTGPAHYDPQNLVGL